MKQRMKPMHTPKQMQKMMSEPKRMSGGGKMKKMPGKKARY